MKLKSPELLRAFVGPEHSKKMSGRKLARIIEKHPSFIDHLLAGRRRSCEPKTANRIAEALGLPVEILFDVQLTSAEREVDQRRAVSFA
ncbi:XRE family transcriptional regulator [Antrihabitans spumae]|uniref:XRE family transcriptional regulator n=1 Tax=Antrihabitans spumae TaxID=3373370 RepID=A0ABW7KID9_9NOCA